MKKILIIQGEELSYISKIKEDKIQLKYADSDVWASHVKGTTTAKLVDTGDGIKIKTENHELDLDYGEFVELYHLITIKMGLSTNMVDETTYIEVED